MDRATFIFRLILMFTALGLALFAVFRKGLFPYGESLPNLTAFAMLCVVVAQLIPILLEIKKKKVNKN